MFEPLSDSLRKIARGAGIAMVGMFLGLLFGFVFRFIVARYGLQANYGIFSLALVVLTFSMMLASLGLHQGVTRYIAYFQGKKEAAKVRESIYASLLIASVASIIIGIVLFFSAGVVALSIFHTIELEPALKIFALSIPFFTLINILSAIFRGFNRVEPQVYFQSILLNLSSLLLLLAVILLDLPFVVVFYAYLAALILTFITLAVYTIKKLPRLITFTNRKADMSVGKELLVFSLPLLGTTMLSMIIVWADTLMLGYFKTPEIVGLYNAAYPLANFIAMPLGALMLIYSPVATGLYSQALMAELRRNYIVLTKWLSFLTMPIFLVLFLFPEAVLNLFFGSVYIAAAPALSILALGFIINNLSGPNGATLVALGESRFLMWSSLAIAAVNVLLNIVLIPPLGIIGAAIASAVSIALVDIIRSVKLYLLCGAQPLSKNLLKPIIVSVAMAFLFQFILSDLITTISWWMLPLLFILYYAMYSIATLFTRSFDEEDIALLLEVEKRSGINAEPIKRVLRRFV